MGKALSSPLNPCECCKATDGKCKRVAPGVVYCWNTRSAEAAPVGWDFRKLLGKEMGGLMRKRQGAAPSSFLPRDDGEQEAAGLAALSKALLSGAEKPAVALSQEERDAELDRQFRRLLSGLELNGDAKADFARRGLRSDLIQQLELKGHRQILQGDAVPADLNLIHGISSAGRWTLPSCELMPLFNEQGQIVACQMRGSDGSQRWLSSEDRPMQRLDGSWPIATHNADVSASEVNAVDGVKKAALVGAITGLPTFGSPGSRYMSTLAGVRQFLNQVCPPGLGNYTVTINFDAGDPENMAGLAREMLRFAGVLTEWGYSCRLRFWGQMTKPGESDSGPQFSDIDELLLNHPEEGVPQTTITPQEFYDLLAPEIQRMVTVGDAGFKDLGIRDYPKDQLPKLEIPRPQREPEFFAKEDWIQSLSSKFRHNRNVMDQSLMGLGKSFRNGNIDPERLGFSKVIWVSTTAMDTWAEVNKRLEGTQESLWAVVRGRDQGRVYETGGRIVRRTAANKHRREALASNCLRADRMEEFLAKGLTIKARSICKGCPAFESCRLTEGSYLFDKEEAIKASRVICHPLSLPSLSIVDDLGNAFTGEDDQVPGTLIVLEEAGRFPFETTFTTSLGDVLSHATHMATSGLNPALVNLMEVFASCLRGKDRVEFDPIWQALQEKLSPGGFDGFDEADVAEWEEELVEKGQLSKAWFSFLVTVAKGDGRVWLDQGQVNFMTRNVELLNLLNHPGANLLLSDGTGSPEEAEEWLGAPVALIAERPPEYTPAEIHQIVGLGRLGYSRTDGDREKVNAVLKVLPEKFGLDPKHALVDISKEVSIREREHPNCLGWMQSSRGSNVCIDFDCRDLVMIGAPLANVVSQYHRYCLRKGVHLSLEARTMVFRRFWTKQDSAGNLERHVVEGSYESADEGFRNELRSQMEREVLQARHRLREVRRGSPEDPMRVFWICDCAMPNWEVTLWDAEDLAGDLLKVLDIDKVGIITAAMKIGKANSNKVTIGNLAAELRVNNRDIRAALDEFDLNIRKLRWLARNQDTDQVQFKPAQKAPNVPTDDEQDRVVDQLRNRFPRGSRASYRGEVEGLVVGYDAGPPLKVLLEYINERGDLERQPIPADFLELASQAF